MTREYQEQLAEQEAWEEEGREINKRLEAVREKKRIEKMVINTLKQEMKENREFLEILSLSIHNPYAYVVYNYREANGVMVTESASIKVYK